MFKGQVNLLWGPESEAPWAIQQKDGRIGLFFPNDLECGSFVATKEELMTIAGMTQEDAWGMIAAPPGGGRFIRDRNNRSRGVLRINTQNILEALKNEVLKAVGDGRL